MTIHAIMKMKRVCIHQPDFVPYLGFFDRLIDSDIFVVYDDVQFHKSRWHHRDKIKTPRGPAWLTLPVSKPRLAQLISETRLAPDRSTWVQQHLALLNENYREAPCFSRTIDDIERLYHSAPEDLAGFNMEFIRHMLGVFDIAIDIVFSSTLGCSGDRNGRLVQIVGAVGGTHYLSGTGALDYLTPEPFREAGISLDIQEFRHATYPQLFGPFEPYLSCLDLLFNCGRDAAKVLRQSRDGKRPY